MLEQRRSWSKPIKHLLRAGAENERRPEAAFDRKPHEE